MRMFGLTGGIASGKSTVARMLREKGFPVVNADELAREAVAKGSDGLQEIVHHFGPGILTAEGELDRPKMAEIVFHDPEKRRILNAITHPRIAMESLRRRQELEEKGVIAAFYEAPLLFENQLHLAMDASVLVAAPEETQIQRAMERDGMTREQAGARLRSQMKLAEKLPLADYVINNNRSLKDLEKMVQCLIERLNDDFKLGLSL
ncbi:MAG: Dephospho-CoA kinase [Myxococcota bacterium]|nr:Dephospho-CoA kinase [Myxococcota bacterium]